MFLCQMMFIGTAGLVKKQIFSRYFFEFPETVPLSIAIPYGTDRVPSTYLVDHL